MSSPGEVSLTWWQTPPPPAAIVWCRFPNDLTSEKPGPKSRPALVFSVRFADNPPAGRYVVQVAYGTSKLKTGRRPFDFTIANAATLGILRLPQATRFDLDQVLWLPWAQPFFEARKPDERYASPVVSTLPAEMQRMLAWTMADRDRHGLNGAFRSGPKAQRS